MKYADRLLRMIDSFMDCSLISELTLGITEQRQIRVALKAIEMDLHLLQHTFYHALCVINLALFQYMKFVYLADG